MTLNGLELALLSARLNLILKKTSEKQKQTTNISILNHHLSF